MSKSRLLSRTVHRATNVALALTMVLSLMPFFAQPVTASVPSEGEEPQFEPVSIEAQEAKPDTSKISPQLKAMASVQTRGSSQSTFIVQLVAPSVARYDGGTDGLAATSPRKTGARKLDMQSQDAQSYAAYLQQAQSNFIQKVEEYLGRPVNVTHRYYAALNGLAMELTPQEAVKITSLPNVKYVEPDQLRYPQTFAGPEWMGAPTIWGPDGSSTLPGTTRGEGIIVGIIDSGINYNNPSFAAIGDDGYTHINPFGEGVYAGACDPADASFNEDSLCNAKLIGIWDFVPDDGLDGGDNDGHGSHTASTAAGNYVSADKAIVTTENGFTVARNISGVAPHANIISYDGCIDDGGCPLSALTSARDQALIDGVDVINYSIGGGNTPDAWSDAESLQWLALRDAGIFVATSAGNSGNGPETVGAPADLPWITTVGASTHDVAYLQQLVDLSGGDTEAPAAIEGRSATIGYGPAPIVYADDYGDALCTEPFPEGTFDGEIVVCDRGINARKAKGENVQAGGAGGLILAEVDTPGIGALMVDTHVLPAIHVTKEDGDVLKEWLASGGGHAGTILGTELAQGDQYGDIMAKFSSRGSNPSLPSIMKPNVTAPGVGIFAAYAFGIEYDIIQGTSMSSPHVAGAGALMKALHPDWSPAEIESALMTTAKTSIVDDDGVSQAGYFAMGSGRVDLTVAGTAGLVFPESLEDYLAANPADGGDPAQINIANVGEGECVGSCSFVRTVRNTLDTPATWSVSLSAEAGMDITVEPTEFTVEPNATQDISIDVTLTGIPDGEWAFGELTLTESAGQAPAAHLPVAIRSSFGNLPDELEIVTRRDSGSEVLTDLKAIAISELTVSINGLVPGEETTETLVSDPTNDDPYDGFSEPLVDGAFYLTVNVPEGTERLVTQLPAGGSESNDLDLFVGLGAVPAVENELCSSTSGTAIESCVIEEPVAGDYFVLVQNWSPDNGDALPGQIATLLTAVVPTSSSGNLTVQGPSTIPAETLFDLTVSWNEPAMEAGQSWFGSFDVGTDSANPGNVGTVAVTIHRIEDDVTKSVDNANPAPGDTVTFEIVIQPNVTDEELTYSLTDVIPAGLTYVEGSLTGDATIENGVITAAPVMPVPDITYNMTTSLDDPLCDTGFGGYVNLEDFGILADPEIAGDTVQFTAFDDGPPINFYGTDYSGMSFVDDGFAIFDLATYYGGEPWVAQAIPDANVPNNLIAVLWNDNEIVYNAELNHGVSTAVAGDDVVVVEYDDIQPFGGGEPIGDIEIVVYRAVDNTPGFYEIVLAYDNINVLPEFATVGVEDAAGFNAVPYLNIEDPSAALSNGLMICFDLAGAADPAVITYQATVNEDEALCEQTITNEVTHSVAGSNEATASTSLTVTCSPPTDTLYLSPRTPSSIAGIDFADEDILGFDKESGEWSMIFDGSDVGLSRNDIDAMALLDDGSLLISLLRSQEVLGVGPVEDRDIIHFMPETLGAETAGTFTLWFDGSDVGLDSHREDIDALALTPDGELVVSFISDYDLPGGLSGPDEDLLLFTDATFGEETSGTWQLYLDGGKVYLDDKREDIKGVWINSETDGIYLTTHNHFNVPGVDGPVTGAQSDIFVCDPLGLGAESSCLYSKYWTGEEHGYLNSFRIHGMSVGAKVETVGSVEASILKGIDSVDDIDDVDELETDDPGETGGSNPVYLPIVVQ